MGRQPPYAHCPPLKKALSTPSMNIVNDRGQVPFPRELQERATAAGRDPAGLPERWMCVVVRRETITPAVGKIVHVRRTTNGTAISVAK